MKHIFIIVVCIFSNSANAQVTTVDKTREAIIRESLPTKTIGSSLSEIEAQSKAAGKRITYHFTKEGLPFIMEEISDGTRSWVFSDNSTCIVYSVTRRSEAGMRDLVDFRQELASKTKQTTVNVFCIESICYKFESLEDVGIRLIISIK